MATLLLRGTSPSHIAQNIMKLVVSMEPKSRLGSLHGTLTMNTLCFMVPVIFYMTPKSSIAKSNDDPGDDFLGLFCVLIPLNYHWLQLSDLKGRFKGLDIYYKDNCAIVIIAYVFLLKINWQYYILVPFPISLVTFIIHLSNEIRVKQQHVSGLEDKDGSKKSEELVAETDQSISKDGLENENMQIGELERSVAIPFFMLLISATYGDSSPVPSHFMLFSCSALGTLALLYSRLANEVTSAPASKPALKCIQMSYMVMMFITAHTVVAEWLGEVTALVCMPELIAGLVWFSALLHSDTSNNMVVDKVTSDKDSISADGSDVVEVPCSEAEQVSAGIFKGFHFHGSMFFPLGAALASLISSTYAYEPVLMASWNTKATVACGIAGCMPYLSVWIISRWPGGIPAADKATQLLKFLGNICLTGACLMLLALLAEKTLAYRLFGLDGPVDPNVLKYLPGTYFSTAVVWLLLRYVAGPLLHID